MDFRNNRLDNPEQNRPGFPEVLKSLGEIGQTAKEIVNRMDKAARIQQELITLGQVPQPFRADGYRFNSLLVGDAAAADSPILKITVDGVTYSTTLAAGDNEVNIPDGAQVMLSTASNNGYSIVLYRYNVSKR